MQRTSSGSAARPTGQTLTPTSPRGTSVGVSGGLPAAPSLQTSRRTSSATAPIQSQLTQNMAQSMTIEEMRFLHQRALSEADAKRTELRLVLASRYRELVGSSDEVLKMKERSQELHDLVDALPLLISKLTAAARDHQKEAKEVEQVAEVVASFQEDSSTHELRRELSILPRSIYRALAANDVYTATVFLIQLFTLIASQTDLYLLANALSMSPATSKPDLDPLLEVQIRMTFLQMQTLPDRIRRTANGILARAASYGVSDPSLGAQSSAAALGSLHFLEMEKIEDRAERLLSSYFESKAKLLVSLLGKLTSSNDETATNNAEEILSKIVLILQHDIVVHSYQIFVIRKFPGDKCDRIMSTLPLVDKELVKAKCSKCVYPLTGF